MQSNSTYCMLVSLKVCWQSVSGQISSSTSLKLLKLVHWCNSSDGSSSIWQLWHCNLTGWHIISSSIMQLGHWWVCCAAVSNSILHFGQDHVVLCFTGGFKPVSLIGNLQVCLENSSLESNTLSVQKQQKVVVPSVEIY